MDVEILGNLSWREGLMVVVALLAIYMAIVFLRMYRLRHPPSVDPAFQPSAAAAVAAYQAEQPPETALEPPVPALGTPEYQFPWNEPPEPDPQRERVDALERRIVRLNKEVQALREETVRLRETLQKSEKTIKPPPPPLVAPQYNDAMQLALQHHDAAAISQQCGISRAEAELVVALVRNRDLERE